MNRDLVAAWVGEGIDALTTLDFRHHGNIRALYQAARGTGDPLSIRAAKLLRDRLQPGDEVIICVGFPIYPVLVGETDGICGAVVLASALGIGLRARPVLASEEAIVPFLGAASEAVGLPFVRGLDGEAQPKGSVRIVGCAPGPQPGSECSHQLLKRQPKVVMAVEKAGVNRAGVPHSLGGMDIGQATAYFDELFRGAERSGIPTVAVGDQGNELGMAAVAEAAIAETQYGRVCRCPCGQGHVSGIPANVTVVGGTSDWGAIGVVAGLAFLLDRPNLIPDGDVIRSVVMAEVEAGAIDAITRSRIPHIDGYTLDFQVRLVEMLREAITYPSHFASLESERFEAGIKRLQGQE